MRISTSTQSRRFKLLAKGVWSAIDTPLSLGLWLRLKYDEIGDLMCKRVVVTDYNDSESYRRDAQAIALISKTRLPFLGHADKGKVAKDSFRKSEVSCRRINTYFKDGDFLKESGVQDFISKVSRKVVAVLGEVPDLFSLAGKHGPGSTASCRGSHSNLACKFDEPFPSCSPDLADYIESNLSDFYHAYPAWCFSLLRESLDVGPPNVRAIRFDRIDASSFVTVPKDVTKDRGICIEPTMNVFFQLGVGSLLKERIRKYAGYSLEDTPSFNSRRARRGSVDGSYATVDLSSASDTIAYMLVLELVPIDWFMLLDLLRTPCVSLDDKKVRLAKFSAMGNGFTFELETIIFRCIAETVVESCGFSRHTVSVFGDDIVLPSDCAVMLYEWLDRLGFTPNVLKSFSQGPFRESCGEDWYQGRDVRPLFLKVEDLVSEANLYRVCNYVRDVASLHIDHDLCDSSFRDVWLLTLSWIPKHLQCFGPRSAGDSVIFVPFGERAYDGVYTHGITRYRVRLTRPRRLSLSRFRPNTVMAVALYGAPEDLTVRGGAKRYWKSIPTLYWGLEGTWV